MLKHPHLQPYVHILHLNSNNPRRHTLPVPVPVRLSSGYNYEKRTTFIEPEPKTVHLHNEKRRSFSSDRALNPSISEYDQNSSYSQNSHRKLSIGSIEEYIHTEKLVAAAKTSNGGRTPRLTPASTPRRQTVTPKIIRGTSDRDLVCSFFIHQITDNHHHKFFNLILCSGSSITISNTA